MNYNVDNIVLFNADLNTLTHIETQESISLTMSQSMLLELILSSKSEILSRDTIIDALWQRYGVNTSGHTLNQYVSVLRKLFSHYELNEVIITIPRVGLRLNPDVLITEYVADKESDPLQGSDESRTAESRISSDTLARVSTEGHFMRLNLALLIVIIAGIGVYFLYYLKNSSDQTFTFYPDRGCEIGLISHITSEDRTKILAQAREIMTENKLVCSKGRIVFFDFEKSVSGRDYGMAMLAFCTKGDNEGLISCENYYYRNWRAE